jgi:site-specific recombinase XerD
MKRPYGAGTVEPYRGQFRARAPRLPGGRRPVIGVFPTEPEAERACDEHALTLTEAGIACGAMTLRAWGARYLDRRELAGNKNIGTDRSRWKVHVLAAHFIDWPLQNIQRRDIKDWLAEMAKSVAADVRSKNPKKRKTTYIRKPRKISAGTRKHSLALLRKALDEAVDDQLIVVNPARGVPPPKISKGTFDWLSLTEQHEFERCERIDEADRLRAMFAWGTGIRQFDQWTLKLADLRLERPQPDMYFYCHKLERRIRVPIFGVALRAIRRWLELLPDYCHKNDRGLVWPLPSGAQRQKSKNYGWLKMLRMAGIHRHIIWHELRDTCASSLVSGIWGRPWRLEEVKEMLHHSSIEVTERYAHLAPAVLDAAASATSGSGPQLVSIEGGRSSAKHRKNKGRATGDSNARPSASEAGDVPPDLASLDPLRDRLRTKTTELVRALSTGDASAARLALELAGVAFELDAGFDSVGEAPGGDAEEGGVS